MRLTRIYTFQKLDSKKAIVLEAGPSRHLARVLRLGEGDPLTLFDGHGGEYPSVITAVDKKHVHVLTGEHLKIENESGLRIHLGIAVSRGERMEWLVQKSTELGVTALTPLLTERTGVKLSGERAAKKIQHWQQIAISACEQCGRNRPPVVNALQPLEDWLAATDAQRKFVLHHRADAIDTGGTPPSIALLVGPEGGLTDREDEGEIKMAERAGFTAWRLGPRVMRTETAPLAAIAILQSHWGDMQLR